MVPPFDIVIYHQNCYDGFTAAWAAHKHSPNAVFIPAQHGDYPPDVRRKRVLICDFGYSREDTIRMKEEAASLLILDHHKSTAKKLAGLDYAVFDLNRSGAGLTWDTLHPGQERPILVNYVEDRDLWRFQFPMTRVFHAALSSEPFEFSAWDQISKRPLPEVFAAGHGILQFTKQKIEAFASRAAVVMLGRHKVWAVNVPIEFVGETADFLLAREPHLPVLGWSWDGERDDIYCSLRNRDDGPDMSQIAEEFGGGGHEHAAGFRVRSPIWYKPTC